MSTDEKKQEIEIKEVETETEKSDSLKDFIEDNQKLLAVIGVFIGIGLFWKNIYGKADVPYISYLCFLATVPIFIEIHRNYDFSKANWNLKVFIILFQGVLLYTIGNLLTYSDHIITILPGLLWFISSYALIHLIGKLQSFVNHIPYNSLGKDIVELQEKDVPTDKINEYVTKQNDLLKKFYEINEKIAVVLVILVLVGTLFISVWFSDFLKPTFDILTDKEIEQITVKESNLQKLEN